MIHDKMENNHFFNTLPCFHPCTIQCGIVTIFHKHGQNIFLIVNLFTLKVLTSLYNVTIILTNHFCNYNLSNPSITSIMYSCMFNYVMVTTKFQFCSSKFNYVLCVLYTSK